MTRRAYNRLIGTILALGAATFGLLLAGVGSSFLTRPPAP
jgi:Na+/glutamate symporter